MGLVTKVDIKSIAGMLPEPAAGKLAHLLAAGVKGDVGFFSVSLSNQKTDQTLSVKLPCSSVSFVSGKAADPVVQKCVEQLVDLVEQAFDEWPVGETPAPFMVPPKAGKSAKDTVPIQSVEEMIAGALKPAPAPELPTATKTTTTKKFNGTTKNGVLKLLYADSLGQIVAGTSASSKYRVVALSERVKVACRIEGTHISIRAEGDPNAYEKGKMEAMGLTKSAEGHWSLHMEVGSIPHSRVLGAVLMDLGIPFEEQAKNLKEVSL